MNDTDTEGQCKRSLIKVFSFLWSITYLGRHISYLVTGSSVTERVWSPFDYVRDIVEIILRSEVSLVTIN